ncbi:iron-sulfur cluster assembly scaffold protein [Desulfomonile tiedjei]|uniref:Iron-sulfur cluster biosynthesis protein, NifU-like protein n=1 Tax=Desulfomonile tiedjei (strain ATCC 49306 / DSM 6799 / DCB-1) TaxID=706587 RepID=I4C2Z7_DESTA|nr:iron-sulfur cluster assembly scaffold protein [Desulfomonile tiedjei]AFM23938.1 iron-sulfur cluster biosynthesis protein, NifU-like protein [Desulfomonile tiedjei DSM 6799]
MSSDDAFDEVQDMILQDAAKVFSPRLIEFFLHPRNYGQLQEFNYYAAIEGSCGETVVIYILVYEGKVNRVGFVTDGCGPTMACVSAITCMAEGLPISEAAEIKAGDLIDYLGGLPEDKRDCAEVAVRALQTVLEKIG